MPPVGSTEIVELEQQILTVEFGDSEWADVAKTLAASLLDMETVQEAKIGKDGRITLSHDSKQTIDIKELKKLVKNAGLTFKSLACVEKDEEPDKEEDSDGE